jgi:Ankyrin repeat
VKVLVAAMDLTLINTQNNLGYTPLLCAVEEQRGAETVSFLIEHGADVHARCSVGQTPLFYSSEAAVTRLLLKAGTDVHARDYLCHTVLHNAAALGLSAGVVCCLLKAGADPFPLNALFDSAAEVAQLHRHPATAALLLRAEDDKRAHNDRGAAECLQRGSEGPLLPEHLAFVLRSRRWCCSTDTPFRRAVLQFLAKMRVFDNKPDRIELLQRVEFELYSTATNLAEYRDLATLQQRAVAGYDNVITQPQLQERAAAVAAQEAVTVTHCLPTGIATQYDLSDCLQPVLDQRRAVAAANKGSISSSNSNSTPSRSLPGHSTPTPHQQQQYDVRSEVTLLTDVDLDDSMTKWMQGLHSNSNLRSDCTSAPVRRSSGVQSGECSNSSSNSSAAVAAAAAPTAPHYKYLITESGSIERVDSSTKAHNSVQQLCASDNVQQQSQMSTVSAAMSDEHAAEPGFEASASDTDNQAASAHSAVLNQQQQQQQLQQAAAAVTAEHPAAAVMATVAVVDSGEQLQCLTSAELAAVTAEHCAVADNEQQRGVGNTTQHLQSDTVSQRVPAQHAAELVDDANGSSDDSSELCDSHDETAAQSVAPEQQHQQQRSVCEGNYGLVSSEGNSQSVSRRGSEQQISSVGTDSSVAEEDQQQQACIRAKVSALQCCGETTCAEQMVTRDQQQRPASVAAALSGSNLSDAGATTQCDATQQSTIRLQADAHTVSSSADMAAVATAADSSRKNSERRSDAVTAAQSDAAALAAVLTAAAVAAATAEAVSDAASGDNSDCQSAQCRCDQQQHQQQQQQQQQQQVVRYKQRLLAAEQHAELAAQAAVAASATAVAVLSNVAELRAQMQIRVLAAAVAAAAAAAVKAAEALTAEAAALQRCTLSKIYRAV